MGYYNSNKRIRSRYRFDLSIPSSSTSVSSVIVSSSSPDKYRHGLWTNCRFPSTNHNFLHITTSNSLGLHTTFNNNLKNEHNIPFSLNFQQHPSDYHQLYQAFWLYFIAQYLEVYATHFLNVIFLMIYTNIIQQSWEDPKMLIIAKIDIRINWYMHIPILFNNFNVMCITLLSFILFKTFFKYLWEHHILQTNNFSTDYSYAMRYSQATMYFSKEISSEQW